MPDKNNLSKILNQIISILIQILMLVALISGIFWWQTRELLSTGSRVQETLHLIDINGQNQLFQLNDQKNDTLIYFFAPWCKVCHLSIDNLESLNQSQYANLNIITIALDWNSIEEVDAFLAQHQLTMPVLLGTESVRKQYKITAFPSYYLISNKGKVISKSIGYSTELGLNLQVLLNR